MIFISLVVSFGAALVEILGAGRLVVIIPYALIIPVLSLVPRIALARAGKIKNAVSDGWLLRVEQVVFLVIAFNAPGSLALHGLGIQYDRPLHFMAAFFASVLFLLLILPFLTKEISPSQKLKVLAIIFVVLTAGLFLWEGFQNLVDITFNTHLFSDVAQPIKVDFWEDILFGFAGLLAGLWYTKSYFDKFLSLRR